MLLDAQLMIFNNDRVIIPTAPIILGLNKLNKNKFIILIIYIKVTVRMRMQSNFLQFILKLINLILTVLTQFYSPPAFEEALEIY